MRSTSGYASIWCIFFHQLQPRDSMAPITRGLPNANQAWYKDWQRCSEWKYKVNDVIFPSGCEARATNLGNKNMKNGIFTGGTSVKSKNIFTDISRYPTGKHEIKREKFVFFGGRSKFISSREHSR